MTDGRGGRRLARCRLRSARGADRLDSSPRLESARATRPSAVSATSPVGCANALLSSSRSKGITDRTGQRADRVSPPVRIARAASARSSTCASVKARACAATLSGSSPTRMSESRFRAGRPARGKRAREDRKGRAAGRGRHNRREAAASGRPPAWPSVMSCRSGPEAQARGDVGIGGWSQTRRGRVRVRSGPRKPGRATGSEQNQSASAPFHGCPAAAAGRRRDAGSGSSGSKACCAAGGDELHRPVDRDAGPDLCSDRPSYKSRALCAEQLASARDRRGNRLQLGAGNVSRACNQPSRNIEHIIRKEPGNRDDNKAKEPEHGASRACSRRRRRGLSWSRAMLSRHAHALPPWPMSFADLREAKAGASAAPHRARGYQQATLFRQGGRDQPRQMERDAARISAPAMRRPAALPDARQQQHRERQQGKTGEGYDQDRRPSRHAARKVPSRFVGQIAVPIDDERHEFQIDDAQQSGEQEAREIAEIAVGMVRRRAAATARAARICWTPIIAPNAVDV